MAATPSLETLLRTGPFHAALRAAIRRRGLTLDRLRSHLARREISVGLSTLSYWQQGRVRPKSLHVIAALEDILRLPERALLDLLAHSGPAGWPKEIPHLLPGFRANDLEIVARHDRITVDEHRHANLMRSNLITRARADGVDRFFAHYYGDEAIPAARVTTTPLRNCTLGRVVHEPSEYAIVSELLFGHPLDTGDTWVFEFESHVPNTTTCTEYWQGVRGFEEHVLIEVEFHPEALPDDPHVVVQEGPDDEPRRLKNIRLRNNTVHHLETGASADWIGIRWSW